LSGIEPKPQARKSAPSVFGAYIGGSKVSSGAEYQSHNNNEQKLNQINKQEVKQISPQDQ